MFGLAEDDLAAVPFLVGLAATFAAAGMCEAGSRHWASIACCFVLAALFLSAGLGWPWISDLSPELRALATCVARNPMSWLALIMAGLSGLLLIGKTSKQSAAARPRKIRTGLHIEFVPGRSAMASRIHNIWQWYPLLQTSREVDQDGNLLREHRTVGVFVTFDRPVAAQEIVVTAEGGRALPKHEVRDWSARHAIVVFADDPAGCTVGISARL